MDLAQDVFLKAWQNIRKLDDATRFGPWLFRIAHNEAYSMFRKRRPDTDIGDPEFADRAIAPGASPDVTIAVEAALGRLSSEQREAVVLKVYQGFKFEEMAEILGCPVSTIKSRVYSAMELMKAELAPATGRGMR